jgi:hypothetical protein
LARYFATGEADFWPASKVIAKEIQQAHPESLRLPLWRAVLTSQKINGAFAIGSREDKYALEDPGK